MKLIIRTLVILAAAALVVAGMFAFRQSSYAQVLFAGGEGRGRFERGLAPEGNGPNDLFQRPRPEGGERTGGFGRDERHGGGLFGLVEVARNLAIMAVVIVVVLLLGRILPIGPRRRRASGASTPVG